MKSNRGKLKKIEKNIFFGIGSLYGLLSEARDIKRNDVEGVGLDLKQSWAGAIKYSNFSKYIFGGSNRNCQCATQKLLKSLEFEEFTRGLAGTKGIQRTDFFSPEIVKKKINPVSPQ